MTTQDWSLSPEARARLWDEAAAYQGLSRWHVIDGLNLGSYPVPRLQGLALICSASWYFSRYAFTCHTTILEYIPGQMEEAEPCFSNLIQRIHTLMDNSQDKDHRLRSLRSLKNAAMCCALVAYLWGWWGQKRLEQALTQIAEYVLRVMLHLFDLEDCAGDKILVLGMGRLAGCEMNFGSDLDLIFLGQSGDRHFEHLVKKVRRLLQAMGRYDANGELYAIDMRLRPHGRAGTLISSYQQFLDFHRGARAVWERQMMTRHRLLYAHADTREWFESALQDILYMPYSAVQLRQDITAMRERVEDSVVQTMGQWELKRGAGGLMDIDFITHYFQLLHGHEHETLRTASTRETLRQMERLSLVSPQQVARLQGAYDFLKRVECVVRVYDMKNISSFRYDSPRWPALLRAMGYCAQGREDFLAAYRRETSAVREIFSSLLQV